MHSFNLFGAKGLLFHEGNDVKRLILAMNKNIKINRPEQKCDEMNSHSVSECLNDFIMDQIHCHLPWITSKSRGGLRLCDKQEDLQEFVKVVETFGTQEGIRKLVDFGCALRNCVSKEWPVLSTNTAFNSTTFPREYQFQMMGSHYVRFHVWIVYSFKNNAF